MKKKRPHKGYDRHHILWDRSSWGKGYYRLLRSHWYFIVTIPRTELHERIHHEIFRIPTPSKENVREVYQQILCLEGYGVLHEDDPIGRRIKILIALFNCIEPQTVAALEKQAQIVREFYGVPS